jgi:hypothetical protein
MQGLFRAIQAEIVYHPVCDPDIGMYRTIIGMFCKRVKLNISP